MRNHEQCGASKAYVLFVLGGTCLICLGFANYLIGHTGLFSKKYDHGRHGKKPAELRHFFSSYNNRPNDIRSSSAGCCSL